MGRSRAAVHVADEDSGQRSKRKKTTQSVDDIEAAASVSGRTDVGKALYHCNYCNKDISRKIRIKCVICSDFDLCIECFSVGAEAYPHKSSHPYRVMDNLAFPLICAEWNADEEILLLEGIEMYGLGNWAEVAEHVGTKSKSHCVEHYSTIYMNSHCFPLPDMSHVTGKNREELLAMARETYMTKKGSTTPECTHVNEDHQYTEIKLENEQTDGVANSLNISACRMEGSGNGKISTGAMKRSSNNVLNSDSIGADRVEDFHADRSIGEKKPRISDTEGISLKELSGYNSKRQEFEVEYDNDAEQLLADMEFKETDSDAERELKLRVLRIYSKRLNERKWRKDFILDRNLLYPDPFEDTLTLEEKELCHRLRVFLRYHSKDEHCELLKSIIEEQRILIQIKGLQEARAAGCRTSAELKRYAERRREFGDNNSLPKESTLAAIQKVEQDISISRGMGPAALDGGNNAPSTSSRATFPDVLENWDVTGFRGAEILSEAEKQLCGDIRILPTHYLYMLQTISMGFLNGSLSKKSDAYALFNVDPAKVDKVYEMIIQKGVAQT